jgi:hypothetical protein
MNGETTNDELTEKIIGAAIEVHRVLGPGLLELLLKGSGLICWLPVK